MTASYNFSTTKSEIIHRAARILGIISSGDTLQSNLFNDYSMAFNSLIKGLVNHGFRLWKYESLITNFTGTSSVSISGDNYICIEPHTSAAISKPASGAEWRKYWYKYNLPGSTTIAWATSTPYITSSQIELPEDFITIEKATIRYLDNEYTMDIKPYSEYFTDTDKYDGTQIPDYIAINYSTTGGTMYISQIPNNDTYNQMSMMVLGLKYFTDADAVGDVPDFPSKFYDVLVYGLAEKMSDEAHVDLNERVFLSNKYKELLALAKGFDRDFINIPFVRSAY